MRSAIARPGLSLIADRLLPSWFILWSAVRLYQLGLGQLGLDTSWLGRDFRIYRNAAVALLQGADPWTAYDTWNGTDWHFGAPPSAAQLFVPFTALPEGLGLLVFLGLSVALTIAAIRHLGLAWWWIFFPPLMEGIVAANPHVPAFALLVLGGGSIAGGIGRAVAVAAKVYAAIPLVALRDRRALAVTGALLVVSVLLAPAAWREYVERFGLISGRLAQEAVGGVSAALFLDPAVFAPLIGDPAIAAVAGLALFGLIAALVALVAVRDVPSAGWLAVPLLWPAGQYSYGSFTLPIARRLSTWIIAVPTIPTYLLGLIILAYEVVAGRSPSGAASPPIGLAAWARSPRR